MREALEVWISAELVEKIGEHGAKTYPHECCGALLGRENWAAGSEKLDGNNEESSRAVVSLFPLVNRREDSPRNRFSVTAEDVREAEKAANAQGLEVIGWYHSHPDHPARPSEYDREHAWPWYSYVIVSVRAGVAQEMTSWRLKNDRSAFEEERIEAARVSTAS